MRENDKKKEKGEEEMERRSVPSEDWNENGEEEKGRRRREVMMYDEDVNINSNSEIIG